MAARALPLSDVQYYMGHSDIKTTQRYVHHQHRPDDAAKLAEAFRVPNHVSNPPASARTDNNSPDAIPQ